MKVWIDIESGTWGDAHHVVLVDVNEEDCDALAELSDIDRQVYGEEHGVGVEAILVSTVTTLATFDKESGLVVSVVRDLAEALQILRDNFAEGDDVTDDDLVDFVSAQGVVVDLTLHDTPTQNDSSGAQS